MNAKIRKMNVRNRTDMELIDIAKWLNPILQGWINYYGKFYKTALMPVLEHFNETLVKWALRKYDNLKDKHRGWVLIKKIMKKSPQLFAHWKLMFKVASWERSELRDSCCVCEGFRGSSDDLLTRIIFNHSRSL